MYRKLINYIIHYLSKTLKGGKMDYQESLKYIEETHKLSKSKAALKTKQNNYLTFKCQK